MTSTWLTDPTGFWPAGFWPSGFWPGEGGDPVDVAPTPTVPIPVGWRSTARRPGLDPAFSLATRTRPGA